MADPLFVDGVIVIDKPPGPTSHDVVAVMRRAVRLSAPEGRPAPMKVGHTGTLDPLASGVLPLVLGKATRLAQFLSSAEKEYEADVVLGTGTTTYDRSGEVTSPEPSRKVGDVTAAMIDEAIAAFRGTYLQHPPAYSAKKIGGDRAYDLARRNAPVRLRPVEVTVSTLDVLDWSGDCLRVRVVSSAGFYVRSLAESIGERLGTGGHLARLTRTRSGDFTMAQAVGLDVLDRRPAEAAERIIRMGELLPSLPGMTLTAEGAALASKGGFIGPSHVANPSGLPRRGRVRLFHPDGHL